MRWIFAFLALALSQGLLAMPNFDADLVGAETMQSQLDQDMTDGLEKATVDESQPVTDLVSTSALVWIENNSNFASNAQCGSCHGQDGFTTPVPFVLANHRK